jgi:chromosome segregation ATPase
MSEPLAVSKKALEALKRDLDYANDRLDEAQAEVDDLEKQIAEMRSILEDRDGEKWTIVAIHVTPEMEALAKQARGKGWSEVREINGRYERLAIENAVYAPIEQVSA